MKTIRPLVLPVVVFILCIHGIRLSHKIDSLSTRLEVEHLRVKAIDLVNSSGEDVGGLYAGRNDRDGPSLQLRHRDVRGMSHLLTMAFFPGGGPRLDMIGEIMDGRGPEAHIMIGSIDCLYGLRIMGSGDSSFPPLDIGWGTGNAGSISNRYYHAIPEGAFEHKNGR